MKKWWITIAVLLATVAGQAQKVQDYDTEELFASTDYADSVMTIPDSAYQALRLEATGVTEVTSRTLYMNEGGQLQDGGGDISIYMRLVNITGSVVDSVFLEVYRGPEYGWEIYLMKAFAAVGRAKFNIPDQSWANDHMQGLRIRWKKGTSHKAYLAIRLRQFKWKS